MALFQSFILLGSGLESGLAFGWIWFLLSVALRFCLFVSPLGALIFVFILAMVMFGGFTLSCLVVCSFNFFWEFVALNFFLSFFKKMLIIACNRNLCFNNDIILNVILMVNGSNKSQSNRRG